jgi:hypothetical protein
MLVILFDPFTEVVRGVIVFRLDLITRMIPWLFVRSVGHEGREVGLRVE